MNSDFKDLLRIFAEEEVEYLIVGAYAVGVSPCQIDFLTSLPGVPPFPEAWKARTTSEVDGAKVHFLGKAALIAAKKTAGRPQDLADLDELSRVDPPDVDAK